MCLNAPSTADNEHTLSTFMLIMIILKEMFISSEEGNLRAGRDEKKEMGGEREREREREKAASRWHHYYLHWQVSLHSLIVLPRWVMGCGSIPLHQLYISPCSSSLSASSSIHPDYTSNGSSSQQPPTVMELCLNEQQCLSTPPFFSPSVFFFHSLNTHTLNHTHTHTTHSLLPIFIYWKLFAH